MIKSMTGFGKQLVETREKNVRIEIRALNSKQLDLYLKTPQAYREKELAIRNLVGRILQRGKIEVILNAEQKTARLQPVINLPVAKHYFAELSRLAENLEQKTKLNDLLPVLIKLPDVLSGQIEEIDPDEWEQVLNGIEKTVLEVDEFRKQEGKTLAADLKRRIQIIIKLLAQVAPFERERAISMRERVRASLAAYMQDVQADKNRLEQEMIFYIQKLDITEEKIRLKKHCVYFLETLDNDTSAGKKLGFIGQEIGREINTLGSKANDVDIQKLVVLMKDELEKIKEQLFNIL
ncbi:MAG: YicC family protein [Bacteroidales bacterium]|nr:YicC family protein [Bacteroidales bacterium]MCF6342058.1 YicC family protein [Bacteroidales bacterium]